MSDCYTFHEFVLDNICILTGNFSEKITEYRGICGLTIHRPRCGSTILQMPHECWIIAHHTQANHQSREPCCFARLAHSLHIFQLLSCQSFCDPQGGFRRFSVPVALRLLSLLLPWDIQQPIDLLLLREKYEIKHVLQKEICHFSLRNRCTALTTPGRASCYVEFRYKYRSFIMCAYLSSASHIAKLSSSPTTLEYNRRYLMHREWKVPICKAVVCLMPINVIKRSRISFAALLVNVTAHIEDGWILWTSMRYAILEVKT